MKNKPLGKGLQALFEESSLSDFVETGNKFLEIPVSSINPNPLQPREQIESEDFNILKESIRRQGLIQPIAVRQVGESYEVVAGERRWRAVKDLKMASIPAYVLQIEDDRQLLEISMLENTHRSNLNPIEIAIGYSRLRAEFDMTQQQISDAFGVDRSNIANMLRLLKLPEEIQKSLREGEISFGHGRALAGIELKSEQKRIWKTIVNDGLSVRNVEAVLRDKPKIKKTSSKKTDKKSAVVARLEDKLRYALGSQVRIKSGKNGGKIEIDYYSNEDLERLMEIFSVIEKKY